MIINAEKLMAKFKALLIGLAERQYRAAQDAWLGCNNALAKECSRFERLIAELRGEVYDLKNGQRALKEEIAKLKKAIPPQEPTP